uniref:tRNA (34-2'-O)-methyltransferase regulator WDR6 n=1 Tax=Mola mola TaxID=94237 RepID=A0A3Q3XFJ6_MOLML
KSCASLGVLQHYRIHGIRPRCVAELSCTSDLPFYDIAVFGGKAVRLVRFHVDLQDRKHLCLEVLGSLVELHDWALDAHWLLGDEHSLLCVAVAHNSVLLLDVSTGNALVQRSCLEGCLLYSALLLVYESWEDSVIVGGTVFNQLVLWKPAGGDQSSDSEGKAPVERRLLGHSGVIFSISYLQEKGWLASASDDRSVRLWDVGALGGPGGKCGNLNPACLRVLYGHQARVFSVHLSQSKVFSAGEDGACLIWDWVGCGKVIRTLKGHRAGGVRALAVNEGAGDDKRWVATGGADGGVRLWSMEESEERKERTEEPLTEKLTDLKFPGPGLPKVVCRTGEEGGNASWSQSKFVVCTDEGIVYQYSNGEWAVVWRGTPEFQSYCVMETVTVSIKSLTEKVHLCALGNLCGSIQVFPLFQPQCGILLTGGSGKIHSLIWQEARENLYLLASGAEGLVFRWCIEVKVDDNCLLALSVNLLPPFLLPVCAKRWLTAAVCLQPTSQGVLWVCGDRRGSLLLFQEGGKWEQEMRDDQSVDKSWVRGGKQTLNVEGEENICDPMKERKRKEVEDLSLRPLSCLFGVHGKQGVTSVCEYKGLLYSTGRDGCVRVFRVGLQLEVLRVQRACKGMEWLEGVLILEEARFVIVGFQAVHFVVWDPVRQERLLAVPCGGGHRSWSLWTSHKGVWLGYGALVFIKQGAVLASQPPGETQSSGPGRTAVWDLREGVHGRGIGCVCRLGRIREAGNETQPTSAGKLSETEGRDVVVMGGEDTRLTVLAVHPNSGTVKVLSVITDHISSVRTLAAITEGESEDRTLSALLVSAGGRAQMQCYRLLVGWDRHRLVPSCQVIQVASHRLDQQWERRRNRHKTVKMDPETRYMSVVVLDENTDCHLLAVACSDGALRLFSVTEANRQIDLLWETFYHQRCVLSVAPCSLEDGTGSRYKLLLSAATDGKIAVWDLSEASSISASISSDASTPPVPCLEIPAHQSGVNSLAVWVEKMGQQEGGCLVTVASGGDDGQLTVSTIKVQYPQDEKTGGSRVLSQYHVQLAHAAPLTALKPLRPGLVVSTSADQRVCLWRVGSAGISHIGALCSHVADAAGLAVEGGKQGGEGVERREIFITPMTLIKKTRWCTALVV